MKLLFDFIASLKTNSRPCIIMMIFIFVVVLFFLELQMINQAAGPQTVLKYKSFGHLWCNRDYVKTECDNSKRRSSNSILRCLCDFNHISHHNCAEAGGWKLEVNCINLTTETKICEGNFIKMEIKNESSFVRSEMMCFVPNHKSARHWIQGAAARIIHGNKEEEEKNYVTHIERYSSVLKARAKRIDQLTLRKVETPWSMWFMLKWKHTNAI